MVKHLSTMWDTRVQSLGWEDSPGERNGNLLQYYCLKNPMVGGAWQATVDGVAKSQTQLSDFIFFLYVVQAVQLSRKKKIARHSKKQAVHFEETQKTSKLDMAGMLELSGWGFKTIMVKMLMTLMCKVDNLQNRATF